jgi:hemoglobin/transferrin/lactoferrin receptor protein
MTRFGLRWDHPSRRFWAQLGCTLAATADKLSTADELDTQRIPPGGTPGYALLDLQAGWKICKDLDLWMALENMTDTDYRIHGSGLNEPGINLKAGLKWRF